MQTFIVRIHRPGNDQVELHGTVDEVASGASTTFRDTAGLLRILGQPTPRTPLVGGRRAPVPRPREPNAQ
jgi:hypothetical protein